MFDVGAGVSSTTASVTVTHPDIFARNELDLLYCCGSLIRRLYVCHTDHDGGSPFYEFRSGIDIFPHTNGQRVKTLHHWISTEARDFPV